MPQFESGWCLQLAEVAEQADAQDLKSCGSDTVPVRFRFRAPQRALTISQSSFVMLNVGEGLCALPKNYFDILGKKLRTGLY